jgi:hypothetical protein
MKLSTRSFAILSGILMALSAALAACGTGNNNMVPAVQSPGTTVTTGYCSNGPSYSPGYYPGYYNGGAYGGSYTAAGCVAGYAYYGGRCVCTAGYASGGYSYGNGGCPVGFIYEYGHCVYAPGGYGYGNTYCGYYGCR